VSRSAKVSRTRGMRLNPWAASCLNSDSVMTTPRNGVKRKDEPRLHAKRITGANSASFPLRASRSRFPSQFPGSRPYRGNQLGGLDEVANYSIAVEFPHVLGAIAIGHAERRAAGRMRGTRVVGRVPDHQQLAGNCAELTCAMQQRQWIGFLPGQAVP